LSQVFLESTVWPQTFETTPRYALFICVCRCLASRLHRLPTVGRKVLSHCDDLIYHLEPFAHAFPVFFAGRTLSLMLVLAFFTVGVTRLQRGTLSTW